MGCSAITVLSVIVRLAAPLPPKNRRMLPRGDLNWYVYVMLTPIESGVAPSVRLLAGHPDVPREKSSYCVGETHGTAGPAPSGSMR